MTNPKPLFTAEDCVQIVLSTGKGSSGYIALVDANAKVDPLQEELEFLRRDGQRCMKEWLAQRSELVTEVERLRAEADDWQVQCGRAAKQASDLRIEIERLREALEACARELTHLLNIEPSKRFGRYEAARDVARAALAGGDGEAK